MKKAGIIFSSILISIFYFGRAHAQPTFQRVIGGTAGDELANFSKLTVDSGQIIVGSTDGFGSGSNDIYLVKTDVNGDIVWNKTYGGAGSEIGYGVEMTSDGGYIVVGETTSSGAGGQDIFLIKTDALGDTMWTRTYGGSGVDVGYSVRETFDGGYVLVGYTGSFGTGAEDIYIIKTDAMGDTLWTKTYGSGGNDYAYSIIQTADSGYILTGETYQVGGGDALLIKTDSMGDTTWTRTYGAAGFDAGWSVKETMDGGYVFAGWTSSFGAGGFDVYLVKTDALGDTLWTRAYGGTLDDIGVSVIETSDTTYLVGGYTYSFGTTSGDAYAIVVDSIGTIIWSKAYGGVSGDAAYSIDITSDGGYVLGGYSFSLGGGDADYYLLRTDSTGSTGSCYETSTATITTTSASNVGMLNVTTVMNSSVGMNGTTVTAPAGISRAEFSISVTASTDNACFGDSAGTATALAVGGTLAYTYSWNDSLVQSTATADSLPGGTYQVMVTDGLGCMDSATVTIAEPALLTLVIADSIHIACNGDGNGSATVGVTGGTAPYTYLWDDPSTQTTSVMIGVNGGNYTCTVTDSMGCSDVISFTVLEPLAMTLSVSSSITVACNIDESATITATATGGNGTLTYLWNDASAQTTAIATNIPNGSYTVVVADSAGCSVTDSLSFGLVVSMASSAAPICGGICDGTATIASTGGAGSLTYSWDDPNTQNTASVTSLCGGTTYTGIVTDSAGCMDSATVSFPSVSAMNVTLNITDINCFGNANGAITVFVSGGASPFTYWWPSLGTGSAFVNSLAAGNYDVMITDAGGCSILQTASISEPSAPLSSSMVVTQTSCVGSSDGSANLTVTGGTTPYKYKWLGSASEDTSGLAMGVYSVNITDANGCGISDTATITDPPALALSGSSSADAGGGTGQAWVTVTGGTSPYTYTWNDDLTQTTDTASGLVQGEYVVVVLDKKGCSITLKIAVGDGSVGVFETSYEGPNDDLARDMDILSNGGYLIAGITESFGSGGSDMFLLNTDDNGNFSWAKAYGGGADDGANAVLQTSDGGFIMAGYTSSFGSGGTDMYVVKTDVLGAIEWTQTYGGSLDEIAYSIAETTGGYVIAGGTSSFGAGSTDVYVVSIDDNGVVQWTKTYGGSGFDYGYDLKETSDGGFIIAGYTYSFGAGGSDGYLIKTDASGVSSWTKVMGGDGEDALWAVIETTAGYALTGYTESFGSGQQDVYFVLTDATGTPTLTRALGGANLDYGNDLTTTADGGYAIIGYSRSFNNFGDEIYIIKTDGGGDVIWSRTYGGAFDDRAWAIQETSSGGFVIAGNSKSFGLSVTAGPWEYYMIRTDNDGDSQCNIGAATTKETDTIGAPITIGGLEGSGGSASSASTTEVTTTAMADIICFSTTGIQQFQKDNFELSLYPNPNNGQFTLVMKLNSSSKSQNITIYNMNGMIVKSKDLSGSGNITLDVDLGDAPAGMYYVRVLSNNAYSTKKVIIQ